MPKRQLTRSVYADCMCELADAAIEQGYDNRNYWLNVWLAADVLGQWSDKFLDWNRLGRPSSIDPYR